VATDVQLYGTTVPAGSVIVVLPGAANRDDRAFANAETFDIRREPSQIFTFSFGPHFCLGASLARLELQIALEAVLKRFPEWTVDLDNAVMVSGIDTRGWDRLPVEV
jgi:cytochrome P450